MYANSNLVVTAWEEEKLVGIARSLTDYVYSCYLADLAIRKEYQKEGIGKELISLIGQRIGPQTSLILLSAPGALEYYPKIGFRKIENGFIIDREM
jgi:predicted N-acetyltransferase YhbS